MAAYFAEFYLLILLTISTWGLVQPLGLFRFKRALECGKNETVSRCGPCDTQCPWRSRKQASAPAAKLRRCPNQCQTSQPACRCKDGYYRFNDQCLLLNDCPVERCQKNEKVATCAYNIQCQPSCSHQKSRKLVVNGFDLCSWQVCDVHTCVCADGYIRDDQSQQCIPAGSCPSSRRS